ncbi:hypothetical protein MKW92_023987 [Papaver armeniacum]|nr:hypothetical protein MKW92_023987 [Papaver armeniacum]
MLEGMKLIDLESCYYCPSGQTIGIGNVFSSLIRSVARNSSLAKQLFGYAILGFATTNDCLLALMMAFLILFVFDPSGPNRTIL